jgi:hypothetical protein
MTAPATASQADRFLWSTGVGELMSDHLFANAPAVRRRLAAVPQDRLNSLFIPTEMRAGTVAFYLRRRIAVV